MPSGRAAVLAALAVGAALVVHVQGLGAAALWQDEAETAVLAQRVLARGLPYVDDGRNLVSQNQGRDSDERGLWNYSPWLALYAAAAGMAALGPTAFAARLPFALCALGALVILHRLSRRWSGSEGVAAAAVGLTLASVPWLLHARQCRWYALAALCSLYLWWAYEEFLESRRRASLHLVLASVALFHANFLVFFAVAGGAALHFLAAHARRRAPERGDLRAAAAVFFVLAPAMKYFAVFSRAGGAGGVPVSRLGNLSELAWGLDAHVFPFLAAAAALWAARRAERLRRPLALLGGGVLLLVLAPHFFFRYLVVFIPLAAHVMAETGAFLAGRGGGRRGAERGVPPRRVGPRHLPGPLLHVPHAAARRGRRAGPAPGAPGRGEVGGPPHRRGKRFAPHRLGEFRAGDAGGSERSLGEPARSRPSRLPHADRPSSRRRLSPPDVMGLGLLVWGPGP